MILKRVPAKVAPVSVFFLHLLQHFVFPFHWRTETLTLSRTDPDVWWYNIPTRTIRSLNTKLNDGNATCDFSPPPFLPGRNFLQSSDNL